MPTLIEQCRYIDFFYSQIVDIDKPMKDVCWQRGEQIFSDIPAEKRKLRDKMQCTKLLLGFWVGLLHPKKYFWLTANTVGFFHGFLSPSSFLWWYVFLLNHTRQRETLLNSCACTYHLVLVCMELHFPACMFYLNT